MAQQHECKDIDPSRAKLLHDYSAQRQLRTEIVFGGNGWIMNITRSTAGDEEAEHAGFGGLRRPVVELPVYACPFCGERL